MNSSHFNKLIHKHSNALKALAVKFTNDYEDAQDLLQDTLIKALKYRHNFHEGTNLRGWLFVVMKNTFISNYHKKIKTDAFVTIEEGITHSNLLLISTANGAESNFAMADIKKALAGIPKEYSQPFVQFVEGYKYEEIAQQMGVPIGTVKTRIHQARELLKKQLKMYRSQIN